MDIKARTTVAVLRLGEVLLRKHSTNVHLALAGVSP